MHSVSRPAVEPPELVNLRDMGGEDFGSLDAPLDRVFDGVCGYCERKPLWRSGQDGVGTQDTDLPDREGLLFTCDHFRPRYLFPSLIYDWHNLVYACQPCNSVKGGQWPNEADEADSYINPCEDPVSPASPDSIFSYDLDSGRITVGIGITGVARANAVQTIRDLALNDPRGRIETTEYSAEIRRISLAEGRGQWVRRLAMVLDAFRTDPDALKFIIGEFTDRSARFSSICAQYIRESEYRIYL